MKESTLNLGLIILGNFLVAISVSCFIVPNEILSGGVAGVAVALHPIPLINLIPVTQLITWITVGLFVIGAIFLGKSFFVKTLISTILYPLFVNMITYATGNAFFVTSDILASLYSGIFVGLGVGIVFRTGASTGGMDIPSLLINKYFGIKLSVVCLAIDGLTVILGISTYSIEEALIGLISVFVSSIVIDKTLSYGGEKAKSLMIISDKYAEIVDAIVRELDRGVTILNGEGGYTGETKKVLLVVVTSRQYPETNKLINEIDPNAFLIVQDAHEITGNGFTYFKELEKIVE